MDLQSKTTTIIKTEINSEHIEQPKEFHKVYIKIEDNHLNTTNPLEYHNKSVVQIKTEPNDDTLDIKLQGIDNPVDKYNKIDLKKSLLIKNYQNSGVKNDSSIVEKVIRNQLHDNINNDDGIALTNVLSCVETCLSSNNEKNNCDTVTNPSDFTEHEGINVEDMCNQTFSLVGHISPHINEKVHVCEVCQKTVTRYSDLVKHRRVHSGEKPYGCGECGRAFKTSSHLIQHKRRHTGVKPYECDLCHMRFTASSSLASHKRLHTGLKPFICEICHKKFVKKYGLMRHKKIHTAEKSYVCTICHKIVSDKKYFERHLLSHNNGKSHACDVCRKVFNTASKLETHKRSHIAEKLHVCNFCHKGFSDKQSFENHKLTHENECQNISSSSISVSKPNVDINKVTHESESQNFSLPIDIIKQNADKNLFLCEICHMGFSSTSEFVIHKRTHKDVLNLEITEDL